MVIGHHAELLLSGVTADTSTISWKFIPKEEEVVNREEGLQVQKSEQWWEAPESFHQVHKPWSTGAAAENRCAQRDILHLFQLSCLKVGVGDLTLILSKLIYKMFCRDCD